jgi:hypothetical protein
MILLQCGGVQGRGPVCQHSLIAFALGRPQLMWPQQCGDGSSSRVIRSVEWRKGQPGHCVVKAPYLRGLPSRLSKCADWLFQVHTALLAQEEWATLLPAAVGKRVVGGWHRDGQPLASLSRWRRHVPHETFHKTAEFGGVLSTSENVTQAWDSGSPSVAPQCRIFCPSKKSRMGRHRSSWAG